MIVSQGSAERKSRSFLRDDGREQILPTLEGWKAEARARLRPSLYMMATCCTRTIDRERLEWRGVCTNKRDNVVSDDVSRSYLKVGTSQTGNCRLAGFSLAGPSSRGISRPPTGCGSWLGITRGRFVSAQSRGSSGGPWTGVNGLSHRPSEILRPVTGPRLGQLPQYSGTGGGKEGMELS